MSGLVDATAAGVAFSANPVTGDPDQTLVNAVPGLGDRLVSGELTPDEWSVRGNDARAAKDVNALAALDAELADTRRAQLDDIGGALDAQQYDKAALGVRQLMFLEKFGDEVAAAFDRMTD